MGEADARISKVAETLQILILGEYYIASETSNVFSLQIWMNEICTTLQIHGVN